MKASVVLAVLKDLEAVGCPPTQRTLLQCLQSRSTSSLARALACLEKQGRIVRKPLKVIEIQKGA